MHSQQKNNVDLSIQTQLLLTAESNRILDRDNEPSQPLDDNLFEFDSMKLNLKHTRKDEHATALGHGRDSITEQER